MGRPVVLSNGQLFVGLDESGLVHDFYYPYVGLDNLTTARSSQHKIGVWVDGKFHWTNDGTWTINISFEPDALISDVHMHSDDLEVSLHFRDFVDTEYNALVRSVEISNEADKTRDIRLFMHQVFQISRAGRADTAMYVPDDNYILDYKGRCCLLIAGKITNGRDFDQYSVGNYAIEGKEGTFMDAEDGELTGNAVEHGGVDSVIRFQKEVQAHETFNVDYWVVAADSQSDAQVVHTHLKYYSVQKRADAVRKYWQDWIAVSSAKKLVGITDDQKIELQKSMLVIKAHCDVRGSILASGDSSIFNFGRDYYCYCWPRDAAYAVWPLIRLGLYEEARNFFDFARDTRHPEGYLMHKYQPDRAIGSTWHPLVHGRAKELAIQEDETASVIFMMGEYYKHSKDRNYIENVFDSFIAPCTSFMANFVDDQTGLPHASYDLWEEKFLTSTYTVSVVIAALETAAELADMLDRGQADAVEWRKAAARMRKGLDVLYHPGGYFRKGFLLQEDGSLLYDDILDISNMYGPFMFAKLPLNDPRLVGTVKAVEERLLNQTPIGGVLRNENDGYFRTREYKGNPWIVCTLWLAQYYKSVGETEKARGLIDWAMARAEKSGVMSEQFDPESGFAISVTPLVWSHAETINTLLDLSAVPE